MKLKRPLEPNPVQKLAMQNAAGVLVAAAAARSAAQILADCARTPSAIHDATTQAVEQFSDLLRAALNSVPQARDP